EHQFRRDALCRREFVVVSRPWPASLMNTPIVEPIRSERDKNFATGFQNLGCVSTPCSVVGSRGRFWPLGRVSNVVAVVVLHSTLKIIQFGQSTVAGVDAEFDVSRFEFACLVYGLLAGQVIDRKDV